jgi:hypothetical protein
MRLSILIFSFICFASLTHADTNTLCIQKFLSKTVFNPGPADGLWGNKTKKAINQLFSQADEFNVKKIEKDDAEKICKILESEQNLKLLEIGQFKRYPIDITEVISEEFLKTKFDFSKIKINDAANYFCSFTILHHEGFERAAGKLQIKNGVIKFKDNKWFVGLASKGSEIYLKEEANLRVSNVGIHGKIPYLSYVGKGEVAKPVQYVSLGHNYINLKINSNIDNGIMGKHKFLDKRGNEASLLIYECSDVEQKELTYDTLPVVFKNLNVRVKKRRFNYQSISIDLDGLAIGNEKFDNFNLVLMIDYAEEGSIRGLTELFRIQVDADGIMPKENISNLTNCKNISWKNLAYGVKLQYLIGNEFELNSCLLRNLYPEKRNILGSIANSLPEILKAGLGNEPEQLKDILMVLNDAKQHEL